jgi:glycosyltransferase involved in cell wall biosynthesis
VSHKYPLMVCTHARGGMRSVVEAYERDGLFKSWRFQSLWTHKDGSAIARVAIALKAYLILLWLLATGSVSFMHVHVAMRGSFWRKSLFAATARRFDVPSIFHLHGSEMKTFYDSLSTSRRLNVKRSLERAAAVVVLSESWREFVAEIAPQSRIHVINNYVTLPHETSSASDSKEFKVLFLGVLGHRKGIYDLLECWPAVVEKVPGARLLVGGNGEIDAAKDRAASLGVVGSVDFLGWIDGEQKVELLKSADAFVLPSYNEGLPMSVLEAMSWAKPVVTTRVGGIPELITDAKDGLLINAGDQDSLARTLISLGLDSTLRQRLGNAGRARVESNFSDVAILPRLEAVYTEVTSHLKKE